MITVGGLFTVLEKGKLFKQNTHLFLHILKQLSLGLKNTNQTTFEIPSNITPFRVLILPHKVSSVTQELYVSFSESWFYVNTGLFPLLIELLICYLYCKGQGLQMKRLSTTTIVQNLYECVLLVAIFGKCIFSHTVLTRPFGILEVMVQTCAAVESVLSKENASYNHSLSQRSSKKCLQ